LKLFCPGHSKDKKEKRKEKARRTLLHWSDEPSHVSAGLDCFILLLFYLIFNFTLEKRWLPTNGGLCLIVQTLKMEKYCIWGCAFDILTSFSEGFDWVFTFNFWEEKGVGKEEKSFRAALGIEICLICHKNSLCTTLYCLYQDYLRGKWNRDRVT